MNRKTMLLGVLIVASLFANVLLLLKVTEFRKDLDEARAALNSRPVPVAAKEEAKPDPALAALRKENAGLKDEMEKLRSDAKAPLTSAGAAPVDPKVARLAKLRDLMRKMAQFTKKRKDGTENWDDMDRKAQMEFAQAMMEYWTVFSSPSSDPGKYAEFMQVACEVFLDEFGVPMSEDQKKKLAAMFEGVQSDLAKIGTKSERERSLGEMMAQRDATKGVLDLLTADQRLKMAENNMGDGMMQMNTKWISRDNVSGGITDSWMRTYKMTEQQKPAVEVVARSYSDTLTRMESEFEAKYGYSPYDRSEENLKLDPYAQIHQMDFRVQTMQAQNESLTLLEAGMTPEQKKRLDSKEISYFQLNSASSSIQVEEVK